MKCGDRQKLLSISMPAVPSGRNSFSSGSAGRIITTHEPKTQCRQRLGGRPDFKISTSGMEGA